MGKMVEVKVKIDIYAELGTLQSLSCKRCDNSKNCKSNRWDMVILKRYPEPMAHGPEACEPSHPLWPMAQRPASRHTRAEAVDTGYLCSLTREIWNPISNQ